MIRKMENWNLTNFPEILKKKLMSNQGQFPFICNYFSYKGCFLHRSSELRFKYTIIVPFLKLGTFTA